MLCASGCKIKHSQWVCLSYVYMHMCCFIRAGHCVACSSGRVSELWTIFDCLPLRQTRLLRKGSERGSSNWEKKTTSVHSSCCTLEPKLPMTHPENPFSSKKWHFTCHLPWVAVEQKQTWGKVLWNSVSKPSYFKTVVVTCSAKNIQYHLPSRPTRNKSLLLWNMK